MIFDVSCVPADLSSAARQRATAIEDALTDDQRSSLIDAIALDASLALDLGRCIASSQFLALNWERHPGEFVELVTSGDLQASYEPTTMPAALSLLTRLDQDENALMAALRRYRRREMARIIFRDFSRRAQTMETTRDLSWLAEACVETALSHAHAELARRHGEPIGKDSGAPQRMVVLGMGKLGAWELNLSSDIDLIFAYPESGETNGARSLSNQEFFIKVGQRLIKALDANTADGFVFRVDMRLRPYGDSGALVLNFGAMEEYYQDQGREWERYAMVKARVIAGDRDAGVVLSRMLRGFTYRRYIDFSAIDALRSMKAMISREVRRRGLDDDVKLGAGGIREVEFVAQCFQLIRGGKDTELQDPRLLEILTILASDGLMPEQAVADLRSAYLFLRNAEHAIQGYADQQSQSLPADAEGIARIAFVMGFDGADAFLASLKQHRETVSKHFSNVISSPDDDDEQGDSGHDLDIWPPGADQTVVAQQLTAAGFESPDESAVLLLRLHQSPKLAGSHSTGRERIDSLMPFLLADIAGADRPSLVLSRVMPLLESVLRRSAYLVLLKENYSARAKLVDLCEASPKIAESLARHPVLLDELIGARPLTRPPTHQELRDDLRVNMLRVSDDDLEAQMNALRYFKLAHSLRCASSEVAGSLPLMNVSDYLSWLAEVVLDYVLQYSWNELVRKHGEPCSRTGEVLGQRFLIVGYGKLGGIELGHGSDLDLVFLHDTDSMGHTNGEREVNNEVFFTRLGQRMIHFLSTKTHLGDLYEIDMRLRPSGDAGMLVPSLEAFKKYQDNEAWTWEHQALVRARPIAGHPELAERFNEVRRTVLAASRDAQKLRGEVAEMREKMRAHLLDADTSGGKSPLFNIKQSPGGIVDIEFMVQYCVLAWSASVPALSEFTDNIRILAALRDSGLFPADKADLLTEAYIGFRSEAHKLALQQESGTTPTGEFQSLRDAVLDAWKFVIGQEQLGDTALEQK